MQHRKPQLHLYCMALGWHRKIKGFRKESEINVLFNWVLHKRKSKCPLEIESSIELKLKLKLNLTLNLKLDLKLIRGAS